MSVTRTPHPFGRIPIADKNGMATREFLKFFVDVLHEKTSQTLTIQSQITAATPVVGRTEGLGTTVGNIDSGGILLAPGADFSRSYTNKHLDNIPDGATYGRTVNSALTANQVDLTKAGVIGPLGSAKINQNVMFNYTNNATVDSIDNGTNATVRVYGPSGVGTTWHQIIGSAIGPERPAFSGTTAYNQDTWVYYDGTAFHITTIPSQTLADGLLFCAKLHTVSAGGGGGTTGGGGSTGGSGGRTQ